MAENAILILFHGRNKHKGLLDNTNYHVRKRFENASPRSFSRLIEWE